MDSGVAGGGGYSGGASASRYCVKYDLADCLANNLLGGGGGFYNAGTNQSNSSGIRSGNGYAKITLVQ